MPAQLPGSTFISPSRRRLTLALRYQRRPRHLARPSTTAMASPSPLALHIRAEAARWATLQTQQQYQHRDQQRDHPASPSSVVTSFRDDASLFSSPSSRRSSVSSVASSDAAELGAGQHQLLPAQPRDTNGAPIRVFTSLDAAAAASVVGLFATEGEAPRRLVTPGKLYENEEEDDEIIDYDEDEAVATG
jgi:hypothetical protein